MENLFRFILKRPPVAKNDEIPSIVLAQNSDFQTQLKSDLQGKNQKISLKETASKYTASEKFIKNPEKLKIYEQIKKLGIKFDEIEKKTVISNEKLSQAIEEVFSKKPVDLFRTELFSDSIEFLRDSIIAIKILPEEHHLQLEDLTNQLRDLEVIIKAASDKDFPEEVSLFRKYRKRSIMLPEKITLSSNLSTLEIEKEYINERLKAENDKKEKAESKLTLYRKIKASIDELSSLDARYFYESPQNNQESFLVEKEYQPIEFFKDEIKYYRNLSELNLSYLQKGIKIETDYNKLGKIELKKEDFQRSFTSFIPQKELLLDGTSEFDYLKSGKDNFRLKKSAKRLLSKNTQNILEERNLKAEEMPVDQLLGHLETEVRNLGEELDYLFSRPVKKIYKNVGNVLVRIFTPMHSYWDDIVGSYNPYFPLPTIPPLTIPDMRVPRSHGNVEPAGIADLLIVKQQLVGYEGSDISHVENILKGEKKERDHTRRKLRVEELSQETEIKASEEKELESTDRFELSREVDETIKREVKLKAGLEAGYKYEGGGHTVEVSSSLEGSISRTKEEAVKTASKFAQDITEKSVSKLEEKVMEKSVLKMTDEVTDKNMHGFDNTGGDNHISGIYQWVSKIYEAQIFNYGLRMMYDFMIPEPGSFLISLLEKIYSKTLEIKKPLEFNLRPDQMTESNYNFWIKEYGASDVQPPPERYITKSINLHSEENESSFKYNHSEAILIDEGYKAVHGTVSCLRRIWMPYASVDIALGAKVTRLPFDSWTWSTSLDGETDSIPFALQGNWVSNLAAAIEVKCQRTERAIKKWQLETHAKLIQAYKTLFAKYEEKLTELEIQGKTENIGNNPDENVLIIKNELKKNCISIVTDQHFDLFGAIEVGTNNLPQIDIYENEAEGPYVRFFEQAFEWENMSWITYPYFWGRKSRWEEMISYEDPDPYFSQFLKSGYCRVSVPVRPGFEGAVDHFMTFGEIWNGGPLPPISNPLYLRIADEIAERRDKPGREIPEGEPWLVRVPTSLVHLRSDDKLPKWEKDEKGNWNPVED